MSIVPESHCSNLFVLFVLRTKPDLSLPCFHCEDIKFHCSIVPSSDQHIIFMASTMVPPICGEEMVRRNLCKTCLNINCSFFPFHVSPRYNARTYAGYAGPRHDADTLTSLYPSRECQDCHSVAALPPYILPAHSFLSLSFPPASLITELPKTRVPIYLTIFIIIKIIKIIIIVTHTHRKKKQQKKKCPHPQPPYPSFS